MTLPGMPTPFVAEPAKKRATRRKESAVHVRDLDLTGITPGVWLLAGTPSDLPYPCRCGNWCGRHCPCAGRSDTGQLPPGCCAVRAGRRRPSGGIPAPIPPLSALRVVKLHAPAIPDLLDLIRSLL